MPEVSKKITGEIEIAQSEAEEFQKTVKNISDLKREIETSVRENITQALETVMAGSITLEASDIHIEPMEEQTKMRVRVDGTLQDVIFFEKIAYEKILSRIKLLSGLKLNISDRAQDGRFSVVYENTSIEIRTSILPSEHGETIVMRILNPKSLISIGDLGLREDLLETFRSEIKKPNGMIIITGPTGSGKTTTLYAFLKEIQNPEIKIITIEDPIEYHLEGISQTQVDPKKGYDFANGLKSMMRQDPDVILVGEIRDLETVDIALQAALTGHLVFTTLHTNDAAGTIARLTSLGAQLPNIGPAINMAGAQRLVRKVCPKCSSLAKVTPEELAKIKNALASLPKKTKVPEINEETQIPKIKGCEDCNSTGFKGRVGIYESFLIDDEMEKFILTSPSVAALREKAEKKGMVTMFQDGLLKVLAGMTTIEEVERVSGGE